MTLESHVNLFFFHFAQILNSLRELMKKYLNLVYSKLATNKPAQNEFVGLYALRWKWLHLCRPAACHSPTPVQAQWPHERSPAQCHTHAAAFVQEPTAASSPVVPPCLTELLIPCKFAVCLTPRKQSRQACLLSSVSS